ncbi:hypothetical protein PoB_005485600 [Plakobranchus ocellatus]|uniref:Uncharacterized protein n=1 Tax=Plakobranchus ocellatus TaxID=259542 RepID=A0AAV4CAJ7_9GAST|nr:hypothetical protein PoB_005485600 [Plakobranchus ocellatus]
MTMKTTTTTTIPTRTFKRKRTLSFESVESKVTRTVSAARFWRHAKRSGSKKSIKCRMPVQDVGSPLLVTTPSSRAPWDPLLTWISRS